MEQVLYFDCSNGISGDMTVAALLDLGADRDGLEQMLASLHLEGCHYKISHLNNHGILACDFDVHLHGHDHSHTTLEPHKHRHLNDVEKIIDEALLTDKARNIAKKIFNIIAKAEATVHGEPLEKVHFHEVGAIDSIMDILSVAYCIDNLKIDKVACSILTEGAGLVKCQHGDLPIPVPAVTEIAKQYQIPLRITETCGEMITPTGIAIVAALKNCTKPQACTINGIGIGAGKRDFGRPNILRAFLLTPIIQKQDSEENIWMLESNIDDASGECLATALEELFEHGARDVHYIPCFMKKNRPAWILRVIADEALIPTLEEVIFKTTTSIGLRKFPLYRSCMERQSKEVTLPFGVVTIKECRWGELVRRYPEYESVKKVAAESGLDFKTVYKLACDEQNNASKKLP
ncbi:MAG: nickel pincer cofactor biosynthesis protein LarC [Bdellovibrionota bacterium]|jgi:uncharacterized protein (TIGR00299 family) protein